MGQKFSKCTVHFCGLKFPKFWDNTGTHSTEWSRKECTRFNVTSFCNPFQ